MKIGKLTIRTDMLFFFIMVSAAALGNGLSDSVYSNFFKEVYNVTASQRAFIEFPRELPGILCVFIIAGLSVIGDIKICVIAQVLACAGLTVLGVFAPSFSVMLIFLFINSLGMHLFMPLQDSVCMQLAEPDKIGRRIGQYASLKTAVGFAAGILTFFGFRFGFFNFTGKVRVVFLLGSGAFLIAFIAALLLVKTAPKLKTNVRDFKLVFKKKYRYYYALTVLHGVQKQIAYVFGSWVIIDLLLKGADIMSLLTLVSSFLGIFFMDMLGKWIDKFGVKKMIYLDALTFIVIYVIYGFVVWGITSKLFPEAGLSVIFVYALFVLDRLSMQIGVVNSVYVKRISDPEDVTRTLSTGISLDHCVSIIAAQLSGLVWTYFGPQWVFFIAAFFSLGNLVVAMKIKE